MDMSGLDAVIGGTLAAAVIKILDHVGSRRQRDAVRRELLKDEGENGDATLKRMVREIGEDCRDTRADVRELRDDVRDLSVRVQGIETSNEAHERRRGSR